MCAIEAKNTCRCAGSQPQCASSAAQCWLTTCPPWPDLSQRYRGSIAATHQRVHFVSDVLFPRYAVLPAPCARQSPSSPSSAGAGSAVVVSASAAHKPRAPSFCRQWVSWTVCRSGNSSAMWQGCTLHPCSALSCCFLPTPPPVPCLPHLPAGPLQARLVLLACAVRCSFRPP